MPEYRKHNLLNGKAPFRCLTTYKIAGYDSDLKRQGIKKDDVKYLCHIEKEKFTHMSLKLLKQQTSLWELSYPKDCVTESGVVSIQLSGTSLSPCKTMVISFYLYTGEHRWRQQETQSLYLEFIQMQGWTTQHCKSNNVAQEESETLARNWKGRPCLFNTFQLRRAARLIRSSISSICVQCL